MRPKGVWLNNMPGWTWQTKIDDERGVLRIADGALFNRHDQPLERTKTATFAPVCEQLREIFAGREWLDLGLVGWRDVKTFAAARGAVVVFDIPADDDWDVRRTWLMGLPTLNLTQDMPQADTAYRFENHDDGMALLERTRNKPGLEGVIGRLGAAPYVRGESACMAKYRWKRA